MTPPRFARGPIIRDLWGDEWRLFERRETPYGFPILMGRPYPPPPVQGGAGGTGVIVTPALATHLRAHARLPYELPMPVGRDAIRRVRKLLGLDIHTWDDTRIAWWIDRLDDLATLPVPKFVAKHRRHAWTRSGGMSEALVWQMRVALLGRQRRPIGWWKSPDVRAMFSRNLSIEELAKYYKVAPLTVRGLRRKLGLTKRRKVGPKSVKARAGSTDATSAWGGSPPIGRKASTHTTATAALKSSGKSSTRKSAVGKSARKPAPKTPPQRILSTRPPIASKTTKQAGQSVPRRSSTGRAIRKSPPKSRRR